MFTNNLNPPPFKPNATMIVMTADEATMNIISWIHDFPSQKPF